MAPRKKKPTPPSTKRARPPQKKAPSPSRKKGANAAAPAPVPAPAARAQPHFAEAMRHHRENRVEEAIAGYDRAIAEDPAMNAAWINRGIALKQLRRLDEALECFQRVLARSPGDVDALYNHGNTLLAAGRPDAAREAWERTLARNPSHPGALSNLSLLLRDLGRPQEGIQLLSAAIARGTTSAPLLHNLGVLFLAARQATQAVEPLQKAVAADAMNAEALFSLATVLVELERWPDAQASLERLLALDPKSVRARSLLALTLSRIDPARHEKRVIETYRSCLATQPDHKVSLVRLAAFQRSRGRRKESLQLLADATDAQPDDAVVLREMGRALWEDRRLEAAHAAFRRAVSLDPSDAEAHHDLAVVCQQRGLLDEALEAVRTALRLDAGKALFHALLGQIYTTQRRIELAHSCFAEARRLDPDCVPALHGEARARFLAGDLPAGWELYESRWRAPGVTKRTFKQPEWKGDPLKGRSLFVHAEQGLGDSLQFFRFIPALLRKGGPVHLECPPELVRLFKRMPGIQVWSAGDKLPLFDLHVPLMSLGRVLKVRQDSIPARVPYLTAVPGKLPREAGDRTRRIGIAWAGNPLHGNDRARSVSLEAMLELASIPGTRFHSFQVGPRARDLERAGAHGLVRDLAPMLKDFADTADHLQEMDLVISVDTALAHLAGALGRPVWTLVPYAPDWRWMLLRKDSPWYPTMALHRQQDPLSWDSTFARLKDDLTRWVRGTRDG